MYLTAGEKACYLMLGDDPDEVAPGGDFGERRGSGDGHLKSVFCPERRFHPPELCPPGFFAHIIPSLSQHGEGYSARFSASPYFITNPSPFVPVLNRCN